VEIGWRGLRITAMRAADQPDELPASRGFLSSRFQLNTPIK